MGVLNLPGLGVLSAGISLYDHTMMSINVCLLFQECQDPVYHYAVPAVEVLT
jgi:hypothetical protein